jgi:hypothetical protein
MFIIPGTTDITIYEGSVQMVWAVGQAADFVGFCKIVGKFNFLSVFKKKCPYFKLFVRILKKLSVFIILSEFQQNSPAYYDYVHPQGSFHSIHTASSS